MTKPKPSTAPYHTPICTKQIACDGDNLNMRSRERGYCGKCADAMEKKTRGPKPLKGENTALAEAQRRLDALKKKERYFAGDEFKEFLDDLSNPEKD